MAFVPFPALSNQARDAASEVIDVDEIRVSPSQALALAGGGEALRLLSLDGRPAYAVTPGGARTPILVAADQPSRAIEVDAEMARRIGAAFAGSTVDRVDGPLAYDQWIVHQKFDPMRPFFRVAMEDADGSILYVSTRTGEVVQMTRRFERAWNWMGAVLHWLYFTPLRKSFVAWDQTVWWASLAGLASAILGVVLGVIRSTRQLRSRRPALSPFRGWLRWHHIVGLFVGAFVVTWIFSGWLSMDHGRLFSKGAPEDAAAARFQGASLQRVAEAVSISDIQTLRGATRIDFGAVAGRAFMVGAGFAAPRVLLLGDDHGPANALPPSLILQAASAAWPDRTMSAPAEVGPHDLYGLAESMPSGTLRIDLQGPPKLSLYIDPAYGRLLTVMDESRAAYAWAYYALHTFKFPGLAERPSLRLSILLALMVLGAAFSVTGLVLAIKRISQSAPWAP